MAVQLYKENQTVFNYCSNPITTLPEVQVSVLQKIKNHFSNNEPVTEELISFVETWLESYLKDNNKRFQHSLSTANTAEEVARLVGYINPLKARLAGLIHDIGKTPVKKIVKTASEEKMDKFNKKLEEYGIRLLDSELGYCERKKEKVKKLHAPVSSLMAEKKLGITDFEILNAIRYHTVGIKFDNLDILSKIVAIADKIEPFKRGQELYEEIIEILVITKDPDIAINALKERVKQAA